MSQDKDRIAEDSSYPESKTIKKALTIKNFPKVNDNDKDSIGQPILKPFNSSKILRSKSTSSPFMNDGASTGLKIDMFKPLISSGNTDESPIKAKNVSPLLQSGQSQSIFNETLILTSSPTQPNRHPTVIKHKTKDMNLAIFSEFDKGLFSSTSSLDNNDNGKNNKFSLDRASDLKINAISPISNEDSIASSKEINKWPNQEQRGSENPLAEQINELHKVSISGKIPAKDVDVNPSSHEGPAKNPSIMHPIRNPESAINLNSESVFKESKIENTEPGKTVPLDDFSFNSSNSIQLVNKHNWWSNNKHRFFYSILIILVVLLISGFVPTTIILANGTRKSVKNYFQAHSDDDGLTLLNELNNYYYREDKFSAARAVEGKGFDPATYFRRISNSYSSIGSKLKGYNTIHGINPKYRDDKEIVSLMTNPNTFGTIFYGLAYSPRESMEPHCGVKKRDILLDLALISTVTTRVRNYGMQCNQSELILDAIQELSLNMTLAMGVWIGNNDTVNDQQLDTMKYLLKKYPRNLFESIFIGNEVLFREEKDVDELIDYIKSTKEFLKEIGYDDLPVGTSEIGSLLNEELFETCDVIGANVHPFFGGDIVDNAGQWTMEFVKYQVEPINKDFDTDIIITEVGWPSGGGKYQGAVASPLNFQKFLNNFVCQAYESNYGWYYFEAFDEPWKTIFYEDNNKWETEWGIFTNDRKLKKNIRLPVC